GDSATIRAHARSRSAPLRDSAVTAKRRPSTSIAAPSGRRARITYQAGWAAAPPAEATTRRASAGPSSSGNHPSVVERVRPVFAPVVVRRSSGRPATRMRPRETRNIDVLPKATIGRAHRGRFPKPVPRVPRGVSRTVIPTGYPPWWQLGETLDERERCLGDLSPATVDHE